MQRRAEKVEGCDPHRVVGSRLAPPRSGGPAPALGGWRLPCQHAGSAPRGTSTEARGTSTEGGEMKRRLLVLVVGCAFAAATIATTAAADPIKAKGALQ